MRRARGLTGDARQLTRMKPHGRIAACGSVSGYNSDPAKQPGLKNWFEVVSNRIQIHGFIVLDAAAKFGEYMKVRPSPPATPLSEAVTKGQCAL